MEIPEGPKRVEVVKRHIERNRRTGTSLPVVAVRNSQGGYSYGMAIQIHGPSRLVYINDRVYLETEAAATLEDVE